MLDGQALEWLHRQVQRNRAAGRDLANVQVRACDWSWFLEAGEPTADGSNADRSGAAHCGPGDNESQSSSRASREADAGIERATAIGVGTGTTTAATAGEDAGTSGCDGAGASDCDGAVASLRGQHWDLILGSDLLYHEAGVRALPSVLMALATAQTTILYAHTMSEPKLKTSQPKHRCRTHRTSELLTHFCWRSWRDGARRCSGPLASGSGQQ